MHEKRMLYEFRRLENAKKPKSVHATYLLTGIRGAGSAQNPPLNGAHSKDGEDDVMQSSPFVSSQAVPQDEPEDEGPRVTSVALLNEEELEGGATFGRD